MKSAPTSTRSPTKANPRSPGGRATSPKRPTGEGEGIIANAAYEPIAHIRAGNGQAADIHELQIEPGGSAWLHTYETICKPACDESARPGRRHHRSGDRHLDGARDVGMERHGPRRRISNPKRCRPTACSIPITSTRSQPLPGGRVLISMRDTSGIYMLDQDDGAIVWQIAGKSSSFARGKGTHFHFQHDATARRAQDEPPDPVRRRSRAARLWRRPRHDAASSARARCRCCTSTCVSETIVRGLGGQHAGGEGPQRRRRLRLGAVLLRVLEPRRTRKEGAGSSSTRSCPKATAPTARAATNGKARRATLPKLVAVPVIGGVFAVLAAAGGIWAARLAHPHGRLRAARRRSGSSRRAPSSASARTSGRRDGRRVRLSLDRDLRSAFLPPPRRGHARPARQRRLRCRPRGRRPAQLLSSTGSWSRSPCGRSASCSAG